MPRYAWVYSRFQPAFADKWQKIMYKNTANVHIIIIIFLLLHNSSTIVQ